MTSIRLECYSFRKYLSLLSTLIMLIALFIPQYGFSNSTVIPTASNSSNNKIHDKNWQVVQFSYNDVIGGKSYPAKIKLLRPLSWLKAHHIEKIGDKLNLSISEFGINQVNATVTKLTPSTLDITASDYSKEITRPVIGVFKRYAKTVNTYTFQDRNGKVEQIHATPTHPFYVINKKRFIAIDQLSSQDHVLSADGEEVQLVCPKGKLSHCGQRYNRDDKPILVYNIEVYQAHNYYVGDFKSLVHNVCNGYFVGYHGTSERSAINIMEMGIQERFLPETGQIGKGFYVGKTRNISEWAAEWSTHVARSEMPFWKKAINYVVGDRYNPFLSADETKTILEIYSSKPLSRTAWNKMNPQDLYVTKQIGYDLSEDAKWLQMVIPPDELKYLSAKRMVGDTVKKTNFWYPKEW